MSDSNEKAEMVGCAVLIPMLIVSVLLKAWAITTLWGWFITPTWNMAPPSRSVAVGLSILIQMLVGQHQTSGKKGSIWGFMA